MRELPPDSLFEPLHFRRQDESPDELFYVVPRFVVHIDDAAIRAATQLYRELLPAHGRILDLMSSWRSHLPADVTYREVIGLGLNAEEMQANPQLTEYVVHNLNENPVLPFRDGRFDAAICTVSIQYLVQPIAIFREVGRVLVPEAPFIVAFSNRCFPTKAVWIWLTTDDATHIRLVQAYFHHAGNFSPSQAEDRSPGSTPFSDPLYAVWAYRQPDS